MFGFLKEFLFPRQCLGCGEWGVNLCSQCLNFCKTNDVWICPQCSRPSISGLTHPICRRPYGLDGLTSVFRYKGVIKKAINKLKYCFVLDLAKTILELFLSYCGEDKAFVKFVSQENVCLTPIPLHPRRKNWRGFNQAEVLGRLISQNLGIKFVPDLLIRIRNTKPQTKLKKEGREKNIRGAFKFNDSLESLKTQYPRVLLFDDVWTTGATLKEGAKILKRKKFQKVWALTLAR